MCVTRRLVPALLVASLAVGGATAVADDSASPPRVGKHPLLAAAKEDADDVGITKDKGLSEADRRSVELSTLVVTDRGKRVRFDLRIGRVDRSDTFTQIVHFNVQSKELPWSQAQVATHSTTEPPDKHGIEHRQVIEGAQGPDGYVGCDHLPIKMRDGASRLWLEIPKRCLPRGQVLIEVYAQTVEPPPYEFSAQWSWDRLKVPGRHDLGGTARPDKD